MKALLLFIFLTPSVQAFEIQCSTQLESVLMVVKTSEMSSKTYLLFLNESQVEKYYPIDDQYVANDPATFHYQDSDSKIMINKIKKSGQIISSGFIFRNESIIQLSDCVEYP